ncbi:MAG: transglycosylase SLT domain-containing protein [Bradyrhizobium sp.]
MNRLLLLACFAAFALPAPPCAAQAGQADYDALVAAHAKANNVPVALVRRVITRESRYHARLVGRGGTIGLMQIKLATARGLGYTGDAKGLRDPETNLIYGVEYLAGAYRAAKGDFALAMRYYASGYYYIAKRLRRERARLRTRAIARHSEPVAGPAASRGRLARRPAAARAKVPTH